MTESYYLFEEGSSGCIKLPDQKGVMAANFYWNFSIKEAQYAITFIYDPFLHHISQTEKRYILEKLSSVTQSKVKNLTLGFNLWNGSNDFLVTIGEILKKLFKVMYSFISLNFKKGELVG